MSTFQTMPPLSTEERDALERSIRTFGVEVPIVVDENGVVIDGHHRKEIAEHLGIECPQVVEADLTDEQKVALSISLNIDRRQVTREQMRAIVAASIEADPRASDREHARRVGVSKNTVASVRDDLERRGQVDHVSTRTDSAGREQPASKPRAAAPVVPAVPIAEVDEPDVVGGWDLPTWAQPEPEPETATEGEPVITTKPRAPSLPPVARPAKSPEQENAEDISLNFIRSIQTLARVTEPRGRTVVLDCWARGQEAASPAARDYFTPTWFRAIARGLEALATEQEQQ